MPDGEKSGRLIHTRANGPLPMTVWKAGRHAAFVGLSAKGRGLMAHSLRARLNQAEEEEFYRASGHKQEQLLWTCCQGQCQPSMASAFSLLPVPILIHLDCHLRGWQKVPIWAVWPTHHLAQQLSHGSRGLVGTVLQLLPVRPTLAVERVIQGFLGRSHPSSSWNKKELIHLSGPATSSA